MHLGDEQAAIIRARHQAEPGLLWRRGWGRFEAQAEPGEGLGIVEFMRGCKDMDKPGAEVQTRHLLGQSPERLAGKAVLPSITCVRQAQHIVQTLCAASDRLELGIEQEGDYSPF